ncbi:hypothetical protein N0V95_009589 [Ascochyta clinopodiicola]|nr:hypothetical protein N0V95_009589 [Ascochyta clinopodiicola]
MRLINSKTLELEEFDYPETPPYAILSHTWGDGELTCHDICSSERVQGKENGYMKLDNTARLAVEDGLQYFWIDTCCIDKANYSELSEAINSMYNWYREARVCYAYLVDVVPGEDMFQPNSRFRRSRWFTRGWTLQELIAPREVMFFNGHWKKIGCRKDLPRTISDVTQIPEAYLLGMDIHKASVAQRISWVSQRQITKPEDIVYCLMGLFGIHMPLLYGEREEAAFKRLQMEILKESDDTSIFAWTTSTSGIDPELAIDQTYALLAQSPRLFQHSHDIVRAKLPVLPGYLDGIRTPIVFDNKGLHISLPLRNVKGEPTPAILGCTRAGKLNQLLAIWVQDVSKNGGRYVRICGFELSMLSLVTIHEDFAFRMMSTERRMFTRGPRMLLRDHLGLESRELEAVIRSAYSSASIVTHSVLAGNRGQISSGSALNTNSLKRTFTADT